MIQSIPHLIWSALLVRIYRRFWSKYLNERQPIPINVWLIVEPLVILSLKENHLEHRENKSLLGECQDWSITINYNGYIVSPTWDMTERWYSPTGFCVSRLFPLYVSNRLRDAYLVLPSFPFAVCPERSDIALSAHWVWWALRLGNKKKNRERYICHGLRKSKSNRFDYTNMPSKQPFTNKNKKKQKTWISSDGYKWRIWSKLCLLPLFHCMVPSCLALDLLPSDTLLMQNLVPVTFLVPPLLRFQASWNDMKMHLIADH